MSTYYAYLSNLGKSDTISREQWNALVGEEQSTDDLLIGSLYPWANIISTSTSTAVYVAKNASTTWIRYYDVSGNFKNPNNPDLISINKITGTYNFSAHQILVPGLYAWNIVWGETFSSATDDQVIAVKVRKMMDSQLSGDPNSATVIGEHRSLTTSWAQGVNDRYFQASTSYGMGYPLRSYSGMHFFNAPPYSNEYEYVLFEFSSSNISSLAPNNYFSRMIGPNITFMKVR